MKDSLNEGFSFGLTPGIITTLGLMVGLRAGTHSRLAVLSGILTMLVLTGKLYNDLFAGDKHERKSIIS